MRRTTYANIVLNSTNQEDVVNNDRNNQEIIGNLEESPNQNTVSAISNMHPLYLQNMDHPGLVLIAKKLTGTENFGPWKRSITIALSAKNKLGLVNGTLSRPIDEPLRAQWDRVNDMVISWILNTVSDEISTGMDFVSSAQEVWNELHEQFASIDGHRVYQVSKDLHALEQSEKSVEVYYHKLKNLWDEYSALEPAIVCKCECKCESHKLIEEREQRKKLLQFLMGLNESFAAARGQILMMNPLPSVSQAYSLVKQEEKQRQGYVVNAWRSKKQHVVSKSSAEAEYRALSDASCEAVWLTGLLKELGLSCTDPINLLCDNKAAIDLTANPVYHARTKHIEIDCHFIREKIANGLVSVLQVPSKDNAADILTKGLGKALHWGCSSTLGITYSCVPSLCGGDKGKIEVQNISVAGAAIDNIKSTNKSTSHVMLIKPHMCNKLALAFSQTRPYIL